VNGRSVLERILERYPVRLDKDSGSVNDPNTCFEDHGYIVKLLARIVWASSEGIAIIDQTPPLGL
jgi:predicted helicase